MKALIGTKNPGKIQGAREALEFYFQDVEVEGISVPSDVRNQPVNVEIYEGARNRVDNLRKYAEENGIEVDYFMGVESGIANSLGKWVIINVAVIKDKEGYESWGYSPAFPVPESYVDDIIERDLGHVMEDLFAKRDLGKGQGGINFLTKDRISRIDITRDAFVMALTQFNNDIWTDKNKVLEKTDK